MTSQLETPSPTPVKTTVGNYFVANYPPFSYWKPERRQEAFAALAQPPLPDTPL